MPVTKVNAKYQITVSAVARKKPNIKKDDHLLVDVQDGIIFLMPEPKQYTDHLQGLHSDIWKSVDAKKYFDGEREAWASPAND